MNRLIVFFVGTVLGIAIGVAGMLYYTKKNPEIRVKEVKVYETKYIVKPMTIEDYKKCYESALRIQAEAKDDVVHVKAYDDCKSAEADIEIEAKKDVSSIGIAAIAGVVVGALSVLLLL